MSRIWKKDNLSWSEGSGFLLSSIRLLLLPMVFALVLAAVTPPGYAQNTKPLIAVFSGATATVQNTAPLITSNKARQKYGLPLLKNPDGTPLRFDALRPQRLAAPVTVYIEAFSAHPLEQDMEELYAPPDGYLNSKTRAFSKERKAPDDIPVYEVALDPADGLYLLPYMARTAERKPWNSSCTDPPPALPEQEVPLEKCRVTFYPDSSRMFEEIDRLGLSGSPNLPNNLLSSKADFHFYRPAPAGGYRKGLPASKRTDVGEGDIPKEVWGEDFFTYGPVQDPAMPTLARLTNVVQRALATGKYAGAIWLEGSPFTEETSYWLNLVIDTRVPIAGISSQGAHGTIGNDGDRNVVDSVSYVVSGVWKDGNGLNGMGAVVIQDQQIFTAREVQKGDDRHGGYVATGGHGGIIGSTSPMAITFVPAKKHTYSSQVNTTRFPKTVPGVKQVGNRVTTVPVAIKDEEGNLLPTAIPKVTLSEYGRYMTETFDDIASGEVEILARIAKNLQDFPLAGFVFAGWSPYSFQNEQGEAALAKAALRGMPVVRVGRGNHEGITPVLPNNLFIEGDNLTASKARLLLMACLMKFGALPVPADPENPTPREFQAIRDKVAQYQEIFSTH